MTDSLVSVLDYLKKLQPINERGLQYPISFLLSELVDLDENMPSPLFAMNTEKKKSKTPRHKINVKAICAASYEYLMELYKTEGLGKSGQKKATLEMIAIKANKHCHEKVSAKNIETWCKSVNDNDVIYHMHKFWLEQMRANSLNQDNVLKKLDNTLAQIAYKNSG